MPNLVAASLQDPGLCSSHKGSDGSCHTCGRLTLCQQACCSNVREKETGSVREACLSRVPGLQMLSEEPGHLEQPLPQHLLQRLFLLVGKPEASGGDGILG